MFEVPARQSKRARTSRAAAPAEEDGARVRSGADEDTDANPRPRRRGGHRRRGEDEDRRDGEFTPPCSYHMDSLGF